MMEERGRSGMADVGSTANVAKVLLLLLNMAFMVAGCLLVYFSHRVKSSGWLEAFQGDYAWIGTSTFVFTLVLGAVVILLSAVGCFGALLQQKLLLVIYGVVLVLTALVFVVVAVGGHAAHSKAESWSESDYPANDEEASLGANFNELYCYAQVPYYCEDAAINDVLDMFNVSLSGYFSDAATNLSSICGSLDLKAITAICDVCDLVAEHDEYAVVVDWTEASCPRSSANQVWCGGFLLNATSADDMSSSAPFMECRTSFYALVEKWTNVMMVGSILVLAAAALVLAMTGVLWRNVRAARSEKRDAEAPMHQFPTHTTSTRTNDSATYDYNSNNQHTQAQAQAHRRYDSPY